MSFPERSVWWIEFLVHSPLSVNHNTFWYIFLFKFLWSRQRTRPVQLQDLTGFDNTGNVCEFTDICVSRCGGRRREFSMRSDGECLLNKHPPPPAPIAPPPTPHPLPIPTKCVFCPGERMLLAWGQNFLQCWLYGSSNFPLGDKLQLSTLFLSVLVKVASSFPFARFPVFSNSKKRLLNVVYFRWSLTCTLVLANDLIDGGQLRAKPHLCKVKPNHVLKPIFSPWLATIYQVLS